MTLFDQREAELVLGCIRENAPFDISENLIEAISVKLFFKKVLVFFLAMTKIAQF